LFVPSQRNKLQRRKCELSNFEGQSGALEVLGVPFVELLGHFGAHVVGPVADDALADEGGRIQAGALLLGHGRLAVLEHRLQVHGRVVLHALEAQVVQDGLHALLGQLLAQECGGAGHCRTQILRQTNLCFCTAKYNYKKNHD
jgi:hypothetical protein